MLLIWQGFGVLVAVVTIAFLALTELAVQSITKNRYYFMAHGWPKLLALWLAAAAIFYLARYFDSRPGRTVIVKATGQEIVLRKAHSFFLIPMKYWPYLLLAFGIILFFLD